jgi:5'-3' exonuclease
VSKSMNNATALIDGDILVYRIGFSVDDPEDEKFAISRMGHFIEGLIELDGIQSYVGFITGKSNYRDEIATECTYKGNRENARKPIHYDSLREYLMSKWYFKLIEGQEADDAIGIQAYTLPEDSYCIMSIDKDLNMLKGWHYNFVKNDLYYVDEEQGIRNFYLQILTGDRVDNIPGIKGVGPKKAEKILNDCDTEQQMFETVLEKYEGNLDKLTERARLLWIRRKENQLWKPPSISQ